MKQGVRAVQPDIVVHARRARVGELDSDGSGPRIGFVVTKAIGPAVDRHRVARRLRHAARAVISELDSADRVVIRALPGSRDALSGQLQQEIFAGLRRTRELMERRR